MKSVIHSSRVRILITGHDRDFRIIRRLSKRGGSEFWASVEGAKTGDRVLFYMPHERRGFVACAQVVSDGYRTNDPKDYPFRAEIGHVKLLRRPVTADHVKREFPDWGWPRYTRSKTTVPDQYAEKFWQMMKCKMPMPLPSPSQAERLRKGGAGFGDAKTNKLVEGAAIRKATKVLEHRGFTVTSREREKIGYDLEAIKGRTRLHVEVKGVSNDGVQFIVTKNELAQADVNPSFVMMVVTRARTKNPSVYEFYGRQLRQHFSMTPLSFLATLR